MFSQKSSNTFKKFGYCKQFSQVTVKKFAHHTHPPCGLEQNKTHIFCAVCILQNKYCARLGKNSCSSLKNNQVNSMCINSKNRKGGGPKVPTSRELAFLSRKRGFSLRISQVLYCTVYCTIHCAGPPPPPVKMFNISQVTKCLPNAFNLRL